MSRRGVAILIGSRYGRLTVNRRVANAQKFRMWECACECGEVTICRGSHLAAGQVRSCGCLKKDVMGARTKENNPGWLGDSAADDIGRLRARRWFPSLGNCRICGASKTERHHKDANPRNNDPSNIDILCRRCHMQEDGRLNGMSERPLALRARA